MFFRKGSSVSIAGFDLSLSLTRYELDRVTIEMRRINSFTHDPLWVVTHTARAAWTLAYFGFLRSAEFTVPN